jgi:hypothetical protein
MLLAHVSAAPLGPWPPAAARGAPRPLAAGRRAPALPGAAPRRAGALARAGRDGQDAAAAAAAAEHAALDAAVDFEAPAAPAPEAAAPAAAAPEASAAAPPPPPPPAGPGAAASAAAARLRAASPVAFFALAGAAVFVGATFAAAVVRAALRGVGPRAQRRRKVGKNRAVVDALNEFLPANRAGLTPAALRSLRFRTGYSAEEVFRKYLWCARVESGAGWREGLFKDGRLNRRA